jgi:hypothetical protein
MEFDKKTNNANCPRGFTLRRCGPATGACSQWRPKNHSQPQKEKHKKGNKKHKKIAERQAHRANKQRISRRLHRQQGKAHTRTIHNKVLASAKEPKGQLEKIKLGTELHVATLNVRGGTNWGKEKEWTNV